jgi:hypothetical protein
MVIEISNISQGSPEWMALRLGIPTASNFGKILTATGKISESREKYMKRLAGEAVSGRSEENYQSYRMKRGAEMEAESRRVYEMDNEIEIRQVALVYKDERRAFSSSPDGLISSDGGFETKDAEFVVQIDRLFNGKMITSHIPQCQGGLYICEREYWIFRSYCSGLPSLNIRLERDEKYIARLSEELERFCYELVIMIKRLKEIKENR